MKYRVKVPKNKNRQRRNSGKVTHVISIPRYNTKTLAQRKAMIKRVSDVYSSIYNNEGQELMNAINVLKKRKVAT